MNNLQRAVYHERQEDGSMLCAQHALNSLLQGNYFTAPDLSELAKNLDTLEESYDDDNHGSRSGNMDDSGFFSVQVLENALNVWGIRLARWRSEEMRPFHDHPENQLAFILNYEQHWFTLRRFGQHWFNLNSFCARPEWVSKTYLAMVLQQAEADGYSVFVATSADSSNTSLPHADADDLALTVAEPTSSGRPDPQSFSSQSTAIEGMEDEDYELQAALHASLMGGELEALAPPVIQPSVPPTEEVSSELDPVAASMERNRRALEQMKAEQAYAQQQLWSDSDRNEDDDDEHFRRAMEESQSVNVPQASVPQHRVYDDDDAELQAALKASLEEVPTGWVMPEDLSPQPDLPTNTNPEPVVESVEVEETVAQSPPVEEVSIDEMRRRRLARFGGT
ncbi:Josephin domain-containing protein [Mycena indigotica]|uniref:ubiquitinyl hydrolase 1 n=1 Tax=Mycena indigotica TaxID=2126181 RepID=A0A8H6TFA6_9AGAR|nr:Josephin domain-containing protein [Mycena indigotica]KAF7315642.1 Josephin domain-containing protein [Mycena indigotica]